MFITLINNKYQQEAHFIFMDLKCGEKKTFYCLTCELVGSFQCQYTLETIYSTL